MENQTQTMSLPSGPALLRETLRFYKINFRTIFAIVSPLLALGILSLASGGFGSVISFIAGIVSIFSSIVMTSFVISKGEKKDVLAGYKESKGLFFSFVWINFLRSLVILGGLVLLIVPGIRLAIPLAFSTFPLFEQGKRGFNAMSEGLYYTKGYWWPVFLRFLFIGAVYIAGIIVLGIFTGVGGGINSFTFSEPKPSPVFSFLNNLFMYLVAMPIGVAYSYIIFKNLKLMAVPINSEDEKKLIKKLKIFSIIGIAGILLIIVFLAGLAMWMARQY